MRDAFRANNKDYNPFTPGKPVPVDFFVGRKLHTNGKRCKTPFALLNGVCRCRVRDPLERRS